MTTIVYMLLATESGDKYLMKCMEQGPPWGPIAGIISLVEHEPILVPSANPTQEQVIEAVVRASKRWYPLGTETPKSLRESAEGTRQALRKKYIEVTEGRVVT